MFGRPRAYELRACATDTTWLVLIIMKVEETGGAKRKPETLDIRSGEGSPKKTPLVIHHDRCSETEATQASGRSSILARRKRVYVPRPYKKVVFVRVQINAIFMHYTGDLELTLEKRK